MKNIIMVLATFVVVGLIFALGAMVLANILDTQTIGSVEANATNSTLGMTTSFTSLMPAFGIVAAAIFIIFMITVLFKNKFSG